MASAEDIKNTVASYMKAISGKSADAVAALFAEGATVEDPVGTEPKRGVEEIRSFFTAIESMDQTAELLTIRVAGNSAAFHFRVTTKAGDQTYVVEPIDVMTFDDDAKITSTRAYWAPEDMTVS
ncbi:steroid delta-isomerase [Rhodococcus sp. LBL1]|uniref:Steroid delta-isomerase n=1 Tax=Prescottella agglutinans TaxID=1644129 RepID=A0ABT6MKU9_9NOCA|nr:nuclear transport factor 2 family protein [Prescottella agglutinans]MDH6284959.1 steroid delta-isomerase [Prescottella agglutinans]MDH6681063.1 steroid delta-isomerase [Rhodococcus sp. LBL1]MDH6683039.1 steroid delta-isomerase [Rhodococcus sp. LBL2]WFR72985.1 nuclear transport factor 2 family protein [Prescottella defluvii]